MQKESEQSERFKQAAREVESDQSDDALDCIMGKLDLKKKPGAVDPNGGKKQEGK